MLVEASMRSDPCACFLSLVHQVRKGMVLVAAEAKPAASWEFDADIAILTHATTIQPRYQVIGGRGVGGGAVQQAAAASPGAQVGGPLQLAQVPMLPPSCNASSLTRCLPPCRPLRP